MNEEPIYDFGALKAALQANGIAVGAAEGYVPVKAEDVVFRGRDGNVFFTNEDGENGIFIKDSKGKTRQVFMYKRDYRLEEHGKPRFHICKCNTIQSFIASGAFDHYKYANTETVPVSDIDNGYKEVEVSGLPLCSFCASMLGGQYTKGMPVNEFVEVLRQAGEASREEEAQDVDMFGYVKNWQRISQAYRALHNYTCEACGYVAENPMQRRFIQVHHIDGDKLNNRESNLRCLCIECHAQVDAVHRKNFSEGGNKLQLEEFRKQR